MRLSFPLVLLLAGACAEEPLPLPTEQAVQEASPGEEPAATPDAEVRPPLYQLLYDAPSLPAPSPEVQRVRLFVWLRHMELTTSQLDLLAELRAAVAERVARLEASEAELIKSYAATEATIHQRLWEDLSRGLPPDSPEMAEHARALEDLRAGGQRERELLTLRMEGIRNILDAEQAFLRTLTPVQEARFTDALFLLRHRLDPVGNPGDFRALVGTIYDPGQFAVLTRGTGQAAMEPLNIGALWDESPGLQGHALHEARREVILFLALLEPGLEEAIAAARALATEPAP